MCFMSFKRRKNPRYAIFPAEAFFAAGRLGPHQGPFRGEEKAINGVCDLLRASPLAQKSTIWEMGPGKIRFAAHNLGDKPRDGNWHP